MSILNTSVSGMLADSNWLSSISQNIANANTTGYKNAETNFSTLVDQVSNGNAVGAGVQTTTISLNALQGNVVGSQTTTNLGVQGAGFFVVSDASGALYLTRNGSFSQDASGNLVNSAGYYLMAENLQTGGSAAANSLGSLQKVNVVSSGLIASPTTSGSLTGNLPSSTTAIASSATTSTSTTIDPSTSSTYTDETSVVAYDNLGTAHTITLCFAKQTDGSWGVAAFDASSSTPNVSIGSANVTFGATGALASGSPLSFSVAGGGTVSLSLSNVTQLASTFDVTPASVDGSAPASLKDVSIATDGTLSFNYTNGASVAAYDIPLANVESPNNLNSVNGNAYTASAASGPIFLGAAQTGGFGAIESSSLESSTVDLATELTNMIQAQSAYEANSKVFQTGANILDVLNGLKA